MKELLQSLREQLRATTLGTKAALGAALVAVVALGAVALSWAGRPHFVMLLSQLDDSQAAKVQTALAEAGVRWDVSQPPGPFVVYVDEGQRHRALSAIAEAGALDALPRGVLTGQSGMGSVFMSAAERAQATRKREWEEMERLLEHQDFVERAAVRTSSPERVALGEAPEVSASVTLVLAGRRELAPEQAHTVASLVRFGLGVDPENLIVSDQDGNLLHDGAEGDGEDDLERFLRATVREDRRLEEKVDRLLANTLGPDLARVTVRSAWDFDASTTIAEESDPSAKVVLSEESRTTSTPQAGASTVGGPASLGNNLVIPGESFGVDHSGVVDATSGSTTTQASGEVPVAKTSDTRREYLPPRSISETVRRAPRLERLSVSLWVDESLADRLPNLESLVKASVGFDAARDDQFQSGVLPFAKDEAAEGAAAAAEPTGAPSPLVRLLLERGVEVVVALAFLGLLFVSLRGAKKKATAAEAASKRDDADSLDPELVALAQVEQLLESDPDRVGRILSDWAREEQPVG